MIKRLKKSMEEKDQGFTLIELLVVIVIVGILAAIAIPIFLHQREKAVDAGIESDLKSIATAEETYYTDNQSYTAAVGDLDSFKLSKNNTLVTLAPSGDGKSFCAEISNTGGSGKTFWYDSATGGLQSADTGGGC